VAHGQNRSIYGDRVSVISQPYMTQYHKMILCAIKS